MRVGKRCYVGWRVITSIPFNYSLDITLIYIIGKEIIYAVPRFKTTI